jgi:hypothetical protein
MFFSEHRNLLGANAAVRDGIMRCAQNKTARENPAPVSDMNKSDVDQPLRMSGGA